MKTFDITCDIVMDENPWIILGESDLAKMREAAKAEKDKDAKKFISGKVKAIAEDRKANAERIKTVTVTCRKPSPMDRTELRYACRRDGEYVRDCEPLEACKLLIESWTLDCELTPENVESEMPICLMDRVYGELYGYLYPSEARLAFFGR